MKATITYFSICGYEEEGTPVYRVLKWKCNDRDEFEYARHCIDKEDIIDIDYFY